MLSCFCGTQPPCMPSVGCGHIGACCGHGVCWTGLNPSVIWDVVKATICGKFPCLAGAVCCIHGDCGIHTFKDCEMCCLELKGCPPEVSCNCGLLSCECDDSGDFQKHFLTQCGALCCHCWCTKQALLGLYCKQPSTMIGQACCSSLCCCCAADSGCSHFQYCGCLV